MNEKELLAPGHRGCAGCGAAIGVKLALRVLGKNTIAVTPTGCLEVMTSPYPETAWRIPWIHVAFENAAAVAAGVESALKAKGKDDINVVVLQETVGQLILECRHCQEQWKEVII